jgi:hypothetical protein
MDEVTKGTAAFAAICWVIACVALIAMRLGNPTAINAVIGCGIPALALTAAAIQLHRSR